MKTRTPLSLLLITIVLVPCLFGQQVGIGQWRDMLPYNTTVAVEEVGSKIYCATPYSLFSYNRDDFSIDRLSKVNGLSDIGVSHISYNTQEEVLVVAYTNTNIDLVRGSQVTNISDIKRKEILGNKTINKVMNLDEYAYLACGFGIVVVDLEKEEIKDTYYIGTNGSPVNVFGMTYNDTLLYAATSEGVFYGRRDDPNLAYFGNWTKLTGLPYSTGTYNLIQYFGGTLVVNHLPEESEEDNLLAFVDNHWIEIDVEPSGRTVNLRTTPANTLLVCYTYFIQGYNSDFTKNIKFFTLGDTSPYPSDCLYDGSLYYWLADKNRGLVKIWGDGYEREFIQPAGAPTADIYKLSCEGGHLWLVPGGMSGTWGNLFYGAQVYSFIDEIWAGYNEYSVQGLDTIRDMVAVAVDPLNINRVLAGSWFNGAIEINNNQVTQYYNVNNSSLQTHELEGAPVVKVGGIAFDNENNAWFTNSGAKDIISVRRDDGTPEGEWQSYNLGSNTVGIYVREIMADSYGQKWIIARVTSANPSNPYYMFVFNENATGGKTVKGLKKDVGQGNLPGNAVYSIAEDLDGEVWVGTDEGIAIFYTPEQVLTGPNVDAERPLVDFDGYVQYLLETETVKAIVVDGANNKWIGTERAGVFKLSPDGTEMLHNFTEDNSPLLSNNITAMAINGETGEVYIGTAKGLIAYKDDATEPKPTNSEVYAYPNPVKPGYAGYIAINGVTQNASVKITDVNGNLIYETIAQGGQATWNGYDFNGRRASSGVYLVFISNDDGSETEVTKILFLR